MTSYNFIPRLFDARFNGVYSFSTVLDYHNSIADKMPEDGIIWLCEHPKRDVLLIRYDSTLSRIKELEKGMENQPYGIWTVLDKEAHILRCRLQLIRTCINELNKVHYS